MLVNLTFAYISGLPHRCRTKRHNKTFYTLMWIFFFKFDNLLCPEGLSVLVWTSFFLYLTDSKSSRHWSEMTLTRVCFCYDSLSWLLRRGADMKIECESSMMIFTYSSSFQFDLNFWQTENYRIPYFFEITKKRPNIRFLQYCWNWM